MKRLLQILLVAWVVFMGVAMAQEWRFFAEAWFGDGDAAGALAEAERREAADTVVRMLSLMRHLYRSGGDPRFAERMPASPGLLDELRADVDYLARNHRIQDPELENLVVLAVERLDPQGGERLEVRTRERWVFRVLWAADGAAAEPPRRRTVEARYVLVPSGTGWRVEGWQPIVDEPAVEVPG